MSAKLAISVVACVAVASSALAAREERPAAERPRLPVLEVVDRFPLPPEQGQVVVDLRPANRDTAYLAGGENVGVIEVRLTPGLPTEKTIAPAARRLRLPTIRRVSVTPRWIVLASLGQMVWRRNEGDDPATGWMRKKERGFFHDFDTRGDEIVMLGGPDLETYDRKSRGGIVWRADLSAGLDRWEPVHESSEVFADLELLYSEAALGSIRYLPRGGLLVVPSFLPGVLEFATSLRLKSHWQKEDLWHDGLWKAEKGWSGGAVTPETFLRFLEAGRTIESILTLPEGPAILVRQPQNGGPRYRLGVLGQDIEWFDLPNLHISPVAQLRGYADTQGRLVLVGVRRNALASASIADNEIVRLRLPG